MGHRKHGHHRWRPTRLGRVNRGQIDLDSVFASVNAGLAQLEAEFTS